MVFLLGSLDRARVAVFEWFAGLMMAIRQFTLATSGESE
jgi:hypothetical protein